MAAVGELVTIATAAIVRSARAARKDKVIMVARSGDEEWNERSAGGAQRHRGIAAPQPVAGFKNLNVCPSPSFGGAVNYAGNNLKFLFYFFRDALMESCEKFLVYLSATTNWASLSTRVAWLASLLCLIVSLKFATTFCRKSPLLFTALALLACNWAFLVSLYAVDPTIDKMTGVSAIGGFLLVYLGGLLSLSAGDDKAEDVVGWHVASTWLLAITVVPTVPVVFETALKLGNITPTPLLTTIAMDCVGLGSIVWGSFKLFPKRAAWAIAVIAVGYGVSEVTFTYLTWALVDFKMPPCWKFTFAFWKLALTFALGFGIAYHRMSDEDRRRGPIHWILVLLSLRDWKPQPDPSDISKTTAAPAGKS